MCFAVQVSEKIKHGARCDVTVFAPVVSGVVVFKQLGERRRGRGGSWGGDRQRVGGWSH